MVFLNVKIDMLCNILKIERDPHLKKLELPVSKTVLDIIDNINIVLLLSY